jgi:hypothetical protein
MRLGSFAVPSLTFTIQVCFRYGLNFEFVDPFGRRLALITQTLSLLR